MKDLAYYRNKIDEIDKGIVALFVERMSAAENIGKIKAQSGQSVLNAKREAEVIESRLAEAKNYKDETEALFQAIMGISRDYQKKITGTPPGEIPQGTQAVYMGTQGSYGERAAQNLFKSVSPLENFEAVFKAVEDDRAEFLVVPIENSSTGSINDVYDLLARHDFYITHETSIEVSHCLLGAKGASIDDIKEVFSHEQGFEQSRQFLNKYPNWRLVPYHNTAVSAKYVGEMQDKRKAAIADQRNAELYNLEILVKGINFGKKNKTRFVAVSKKPNVSKDNNKNSIQFTLAHSSGSLYEALGIFAKNSLNLLKIESRPIIDRAGEYTFFVDFSGNIEDESVIKALKELREHASFFKYLGNYKAYLED